MTTVWNFDPAHSEIAFKVRHMMFSKVRGSFKSWKGDFEFNPEDPSQGKTSVDSSRYLDAGLDLSFDL